MGTVTSEDLLKFIRSRGIVSSLDIEKFAINSKCMSAETARRQVRRWVERGILNRLDVEDQMRLGLYHGYGQLIARYEVL